MTTLARFRSAAAVALTLPSPHRLLVAILASTGATDDGLRAASLDGKVSGSSAGLTQPEREAERRAFGRQLDERERERLTAPQRADIAAVAREAERWRVAIATLLAEALDAGCPDMDDYEWADAVKDAHLILEHEGGETLRAAIDLERDVGAPMRSATRAIRALLDIHHRYNPHAADPWTRYRQAGGRIDEICELHASLDPPMFVPKRSGQSKWGQLCEGCERLARRGGEKPPVTLIAKRERAGQIEYRNALSRWLESCDVAPDQRSA